MDKIRTIQQISDMTGLSAHTLRYYEKIGLLKDIHRDGNGYRQYSETDVAWIQFLIRLKETGMPISKMKRFSDLRSHGESTFKARREMLESHKESIQGQIKRFQGDLKKIEGKIDHYKILERGDDPGLGFEDRGNEYDS